MEHFLMTISLVCGAKLLNERCLPFPNVFDIVGLGDEDVNFIEFFETLEPKWTLFPFRSLARILGSLRSMKSRSTFHGLQRS